MCEQTFFFLKFWKQTIFLQKKLEHLEVLFAQLLPCPVSPLNNSEQYHPLLYISGLYMKASSNQGGHSSMGLSFLGISVFEF